MELLSSGDTAPRWVARLPSYAGAAVLLFSGLMLIGWSRHFAVVGGSLPHITTMKANSAVGFLFAGLSMLSGRRRWLSWAAVGSIVVGAAALYEWILGQSLGIDQLIATDPTLSQHPGRSSPQVATALVVFGVARLLTGTGPTRGGRVAAGATAAYAVVTLVLELGLLFRAPGLTTTGAGLGLSLTGGLCMALLCCGLLALHADRRPLSYLWNRGATGTVVRRLLPTVILAPPALAVLRPTEFGVNLGNSIFVGSMVVLLALVVAVTARSIERVEAERGRLSRELEAIFDSVPAALTMRDPRGRLLRYNSPPALVEGSADGDEYFRPAIRDDDRLLPQEIEALTVRRPLTHVIKPAGSRRQYQVTKFPVYDADGSVLGIGGFAVDITARIAAEQAAMAAADQFRAYLDSAPDATVIVDETGTIRYANAQITGLLGYEVDELVGESVELLVPPAARHHHADLRAGFGAHPTRREMGSGRDLTALHRDGHTIAVEVSLGPVHTAEGLWVSAAIRDVTARRQAERALREAEQMSRHLADHDPLTGVWNRRRFEAELTAIVQRIATEPTPRGGLMILDIDHFKEVNDTAGHDAGDRLLVAIAANLRRVIDDIGAISRLGGDEFAVMACSGDAAELGRIASEVSDAVVAAAASCDLGPVGGLVTGSLGIAVFADLPPSERTRHNLLIRADNALYAAKRAGRGHHLIYTAGIDGLGDHTRDHGMSRPVHMR